ncbi:MAG: hypothetical protein LBU97_01290 [Alistipes sp.]|nr:hypothetical protein [Alistipes sp.]
MAKIKKAYFCSSCGNEQPKWMGRCPACGEWNLNLIARIR